jgi:ankyrin repeat protein
MHMPAIWQRLILVGFAVLLMGAGGNRPTIVDAAKNADGDALRALLQKKVDVNAAEADGSTALHWASH